MGYPLASQQRLLKVRAFLDFLACCAHCASAPCCACFAPLAACFAPPTSTPGGEAGEAPPVLLPVMEAALLKALLLDRLLLLLAVVYVRLLLGRVGSSCTRKWSGAS